MPRYLLQDKIHNPLNRSHSELRSGKVNLKEGDPFTIALFGVDSDAERKHQGGGERSDTIMILSINPKEKKQNSLVFLVILKLKL